MMGCYGRVSLSSEGEAGLMALRRPLDLAAGQPLSTASERHGSKYMPTFVWFWRLPSVTGPDTLPVLSKPCAYWLGFIFLAPHREGN